MSAGLLAADASSRPWTADTCQSAALTDIGYKCQSPTQTSIGLAKTVERQRSLHAQRKLRFGRELGRAEYGRGVLAPNREASKARAAKGRTPLTEKEGLEMQSAVQREEMQALREMYAKHIATTELNCEEMLRNKDSDCNLWYKMRKWEIKKMQAALVIMNALFEKKKYRFQKQMEHDQAAFAEREQAFKERVEQIERERREESERWKLEMATMKTEYERQLQELRTVKAEWETKAHRLEDKLRETQDKCERVTQDRDRQLAELEKVRSELAQAIENLRSDERDAQIAALEAELQQTKKSMKDRWRRDVEALRRELMDYVALIVHILPDNWAETEAGKNAPPELRERLAQPIFSATGSKFIESMLSSPASTSLDRTRSRPVSSSDMGYSPLSSLPSVYPPDLGGQRPNTSPMASAVSPYRRKFLG